MAENNKTVRSERLCRSFHVELEDDESESLNFLDWRQKGPKSKICRRHNLFFVATIDHDLLRVRTKRCNAHAPVHDLRL
jgi:hypothetical protein